jgi:hypothetical protein
VEDMVSIDATLIVSRALDVAVAAMAAAVLDLAAYLAALIAGINSAVASNINSTVASPGAKTTN